MSLNTPKRIRVLGASPQDYEANSPDNWNGSQCQWLDRSPVSSSCESPEFVSGSGSGGTSQLNGSRISTATSNGSMNGSTSAMLLDRENRRGRPRSESLTILMYEGSTSPSAIKCRYCNRVFPREKSLQAHLRIHTGERPYTCDYPGCVRAFTQSGQLKTHQRLHTGERPFICSVPSCQMRFTHANRHCPDHPYDQLKRCDDFVIPTTPEMNADIQRWLEKYRAEREERTPTRKTPKRIKHSTANNENENIISSESMTSNDSSPTSVTPCNQHKSRKGLMMELDMNVCLNSSPVATKIKANPKILQWPEPLSQEEDSCDESENIIRSTINPKKRWLREARNDDLAKPLELNKSTVNTLISPNKLLNANQMRPTVLMVASKDTARPLIGLQQPTVVDQTQLVATNGSLLTSCQYTMVDELPINEFQSGITDSYLGINGGGSNCDDDMKQMDDFVLNKENNKWHGALALMQLATNDENVPVNQLDEDQMYMPQCEHDNLNNTSVINSYTNL